MESPTAQIPLWLEQLRRECQGEFPDPNWPFKFLRTEARQAVWSMAFILGVSNKGIPALACYLLEKYITIRFREVMLLNAEVRARFKEMLLSKLMLNIAVCVQLASKMVGAATAPSPDWLRVCLMHHRVFSTVSEITRTELLIFSKLDFRIPLRTSTDAAELLAVEVGLPHYTLTYVGMVVNKTEYSRDHVDDRIKKTVRLPPNAVFNPLPLRSLHLAAGVVAAIAQRFGFTSLKAVIRLAKLTQAPPAYIQCVAMVILNDILPTHKDDTIPSKKKKIME